MKISNFIPVTLSVGLMAMCLWGCVAHRAVPMHERARFETNSSQAGPSPAPSKPTAPSSHSNPVNERHTVVAGETLYRISKNVGVSVADLIRTNHLGERAVLSVGQVLVLPREQPPTPWTKQVVPVETPSETRKLQWPLHGVLYARFGRKGDEPHDGIDLAAPAGTSVKTALPGTVLYAGEQRGYGLIVIIDHDEGWITLYAHAHDLRVKADQRVREGQVIATVGESGDASGPHLHFEFRINGTPVDPIRYLSASPSDPAS